MRKTFHTFCDTNLAKEACDKHVDKKAGNLRQLLEDSQPMFYRMRAIVTQRLRKEIKIIFKVSGINREAYFHTRHAQSSIKIRNFILSCNQYLDVIISYL